MSRSSKFILGNHFSNHCRPVRVDFYSARPERFVKTKEGKRHLIFASPGRTQKMFLNSPSPVNPKVAYPEMTVLEAKRVDFGVLIKPDTMLVKRTKPRLNKELGVRVVLNLYRKEIEVYFPSMLDDRATEYKFSVPTDQALELGLTGTEDDREIVLVLTLKTPPHYYRKLSDVDLTHQDDASNWKGNDAWIRQTAIHRSHAEALALSGRPITLRNTPEGQVNLGRWTTYAITLNKTIIIEPEFRTFKDALKDHNIDVKRLKNFKFTKVGEAEWSLLADSAQKYLSGKDFLTTAPSEDQNELQGLFNPVKNDMYLRPDVHYQLSVCISQSLINEHNLTREFLEELSHEDHHRALNRLEMVALDKIRMFNPMDIFSLPMRKVSTLRNNLSENYVILRSAVVKPSSLVLNSPCVELTNRVLRKYRDHSDRFLRVRFEDDEQRGFSRINATRLKTMDGVLSRIYRAVTCGITIGDRHFEFLAFGNSQLREHGAYFFASLPNLTAGHIRAWMGRFDKEQIIAKHAARIGQCFSTTKAIRSVTFSTVREVDLIEDVKIGGYNFTDGVGKISRFHAETIARELGLRRETPSVFQFRMGGCKGVLAIDPNLKAMEVKLRGSQFKFETTYSGMEINRCSEYWAATLNRQLILVLSTLGVADEAFLDIQDALIQQMEDAMEDDNAAIEALTRTVDANRMTLTIAGLVLAGFRASREPFVTSLIRLWRAWSTKHLKEKAKIPISEGAFVLGCTDETKTLKGYFFKDRIHQTDDVSTAISKLPEVFIQIIHPATGKRKVITGLCTIARNPSLHAGDIRVVNAVDVPALHHLVDVLVLPQTGDRDLASMCSGGDLDGDDYVVIWDQRLVPAIWNHEPMDYTPPQPKKLDRAVTQDDITKFFVKYMKNDFLPTIARSHMAWADYLDGGVRNEKCLELAMLHSKAVDYPKTGQPAEMGRHLTAKKWPHFMQRKNGSMYHSDKVLGQLFDSVTNVNFQPDHTDTFDERILNACEPDDKIMKAARELKRGYDVSLQQIMAQHDIETEFEVWSTFVLDHSKASKDYKFHEEIGQLAGCLKSQYYDLVVERAGGKKWFALVPWAVAMYRATRDEFEAAKRSEDNVTPMISFPWVLQGTLVQIAKTFDQAKLKGANVKGIDQTMNYLDPNTEIIEDPYVPPEAAPEDDAKGTEQDVEKGSTISSPKADAKRTGSEVIKSPSVVSASLGLQQLESHQPTSKQDSKSPQAKQVTKPSASSVNQSPKVNHRKSSSSDYDASASSAANSISELKLTARSPPALDCSQITASSTTESERNLETNPVEQVNGDGDDLIVLEGFSAPAPVEKALAVSSRAHGDVMALKPLVKKSQGCSEEAEDDDDEEYEDPLLSGGMVGEVWA